MIGLLSFKTFKNLGQGFENLGQDMALYGQEIVLSLLILVLGLMVVKVLVKYFKLILQRVTTNQQAISTAGSVFRFLLIAIVLIAALHVIGVPAIIIRRTFVALTLAIIGLRVFLRRYLPTLPYKVGNTIQVGANLGKVEALTLLNTRLKTFDGKTLFIPNKMIISGIVNNYHFTPTRRVSINVTISYDDDLGKAKEILKQILVEDPRVAEKPAPSVYVLKLGDDGVELSARGWVDNIKYFKTRSDCLEKTKLRFDQAGITIPFPQRTLHIKERAADAKLTKTEIEAEDRSEPLPDSEDHVKDDKPVTLVTAKASDPRTDT